MTQTETRIFHYDQIGHLIAETNQSGQMLAELVYLGDQLLAMIKPGESAYYFHNDHLGTPQVLMDDTQTIAWKAVYTPFGEAVASIQTVDNPFRFPGQYYDPETGLHYNYFRYYNPQTGRYITPDPIGLEGGINLFSYAYNNPLLNADEHGLYVGGVGIGGAGALKLLGKYGISGSGCVMWVHDDKGNWGIVACGSGGGAINSGGIIGLQTSHLWGVESVCDLEDIQFALSGGGGYASGPGIAGDIGKSGLNVIVGVGGGKWGGVLNILSGCKLIYVANPCPKKKCEREVY